MTRRLLFTYLGLTLLIVASLEVPLAINYRQQLDDDLASDLVRDGYAIAGLAEETAEGDAAVDLGAVVAEYTATSGARVVIVDGSGKLLADSRPEAGSTDFSSRPEIATALDGVVATGTRHSETLQQDMIYAAVPIASSGDVHGAVRVTYSTDELTSRWRNYLGTLVAIAGICLLAAALLGVLFARWVTRPLRQLEDAAAAIAGGALDVRADVGAGPPEVQKLASTFNTMASEIDELVGSQQAFVADASHQLRSPLAALQLRLENVQADLARRSVTPPSGSSAPRGDPEQDLMAADLDAALEETNRLARVIDGLLALARADRIVEGSESMRPDAVDLDALLAARRTAWQPYAAERGVVLHLGPSDGTVLAGEDRLSQAIDNLVSNAIDAVGERGGNVRLCTASAEHGEPSDGSGQDLIDIHVIDDGPGMTASERARAFDRFWRGAAVAGASPAGGRRGGGSSGLGLAIAQKLVQADHGEMLLRPADGGGLDAVIRLPAAP